MIRKLFIASKGEVAYKGNQSIKLLSSDKLLVNYNFSGKHGKHNNWIQCEAKFGEECILLINELIEHAQKKELSYMAKILFRNGKIYLHVSVPTDYTSNILGRLIRIPMEIILLHST